VQADNLGLLGHKVELQEVVETTSARGQEHAWEWPAQLLKHEGWVSKGFKKTQYKSLLIYDKQSSYQMSAEMAQLNSIQDALASKWRSNPCLFKKDNWKAGADKDKKAHQQWVISKPEMLEAVQPWSMSSSTTTTATDGLEKWFSTTAGLQHRRSALEWYSS